MRCSVRAVFTLLAAALPFALAEEASAQRSRADDSVLLDTLVPLAATGTVDLTNIGGRITVTGWDRNEVRVLATGTAAPRPRPAPRPAGGRDEPESIGTGGELRFQATSARVSLSADQEYHGATDGSTRFEVTVPAGARVIMNSMTGELIARDLRGEVEARSMNGTVSLTSVGRAQASSMSGSVRIIGATAGVRVSAVTGDLVLQDVQGDIEASSTSGNVVIRSSRAASVRAGTMSGNVRYEGTLDRSGRYELQSHSGNVTLVLPADAVALIAAESFSGSIVSDFTIVLQPGTVGSHRSFELGIGGAGSAGAGGARVSAKSFSGNIAIRRSGGASESGAAAEPERDAGITDSPATESRR